MLQSIDATQAQQTSTLMDHINNIVQIGNIIDSSCPEYSATHPSPVLLPPAPPGPALAVAQTPLMLILAMSRFALLGFLMEGLQR